MSDQQLFTFGSQGSIPLISPISVNNLTDGGRSVSVTRKITGGGEGFQLLLGSVVQS